MLQELNLDPPGHLIELVHHAIDTTADYRAQALRYQLAHGKEGLVIKIPTATYFQSQAWLKVKQRCTYDCIITGFEFGKVGGKYEDTVGALKVAVTDSTNSELREICKVIPGDDATRDRLLAKLADLAQSEIVNLGLIAELEAQCITKDGRLRHPRIIRWRTDRSAPNTVNFADGSVVG
jgi:ATP-dependent DNA ligase